MEFRLRSQNQNRMMFTTEPVSASPSILPCSHTHTQMEFEMDSPIKELRRFSDNSSYTRPSDPMEKLFKVQVRPLSNHTLLSPRQQISQWDNNLNQQLNAQTHNLTQKQAMQSHIANLLRQLESERIKNKAQYEKITQLNNELASHRMRANLMSDELTRVKMNSQYEIQGLKKEVEMLRQEKINMEKIKFDSNSCQLEKTMRMEGNHDIKLEVTAIRKNNSETKCRPNSTKPLVNTGVSPFDIQNKGVLEAKKRSDSTNGHSTSLKKEISSVLLEKKQLPAHYPPPPHSTRQLQPRKAIRYGISVNQLLSHTNNHVILQK